MANQKKEEIQNKKSVMGITLARIRKAHGLTQEQVADILKIKRSTYAYYERNITPTLENISKLSTLFSVPVHDLMYGEPEKIHYAGGRLNNAGNEEAKGSYGQISKDERIFLSYYRLLPENLKEKFKKEIKDCADKNE